MKPHKHAELIKAWADGAEIQVFKSTGWETLPQPYWSDICEYRIKPEPKTDVVQNLYIEESLCIVAPHKYIRSNLRLTFDGETGELKSAEVLK